MLGWSSVLLVPSSVRAVFVELAEGAVCAVRALAVKTFWMGAVGGPRLPASRAERVVDTLVMELSA